MHVLILNYSYYCCLYDTPYLLIDMCANLYIPYYWMSKKKICWIYEKVSEGYRLPVPTWLKQQSILAIAYCLSWPNIKRHLLFSSKRIWLISATNIRILAENKAQFYLRLLLSLRLSSSMHISSYLVSILIIILGHFTALEWLDIFIIIGMKYEYLLKHCYIK